MALRLTSNLLYGVALVYKQKTDYLNNDTVLMKTRIQRDIMYGHKLNNGGDKLLLDGGKNSITVKNGFKDRSNRQVLLNDDPMFNIHDNFMPSLEQLDFLQSTHNPNEVAKLQRVDGIRNADVSNKILSTTIQSSQLSSSQVDRERRTAVDDLDANDPEFAFDEQGLLLDLDITGVENDLVPLPQVQHPPVEDDYGIDFDFGYDDPVLNENENKHDVAKIQEMNEIIEERPIQEEDGNVENQQIGGKKSRKKRKLKDSAMNIVVDDPISLFTDDLRFARDNYRANMIKKSAKKLKIVDKLTNLKKAIEFDSYLPTFNTPFGLNEMNRGRPRHRHNHNYEDFVDGLMRDRGSSYSIEFRRNESLNNRRNSRSSISSINLPLIQPPQEPVQNDDDNYDYFDFNFGYDDENVVPINQRNAAPNSELSEDNSSKKRSSSTIRRIDTVAEDHIMDFDIDFGSGDNELYDYPRSGSARRSSQNNDLTADEINLKYGKQTLKFLKYIETRCLEEDQNSITFEALIDQNSNKSIIVKSFYEILQLATLKQIKIENNQHHESRFEMMKTSDFKIRI